MAPTSVEVCQRLSTSFAFPQDLTSLPEQKKAALRRVEMELDEADEMVRASPSLLSTGQLTQMTWS